MQGGNLSFIFSWTECRRGAYNIYIYIDVYLHRLGQSLRVMTWILWFWWVQISRCSLVHNPISPKCFKQNDCYGIFCFYLRIWAISALFHPFGFSWLQHDVPHPLGHAPVGVSRIGRTSQTFIVSNSVSLRKQIGRWVWFQQRGQQLYSWRPKKGISTPTKIWKSLRNRPGLDLSINVCFVLWS